MKPRCLYYDTRDDKLECKALLARLPPSRRVLFLARCCRLVPPGKRGDVLRPGRTTRELARAARWDSSADERLTWDVLLSLWALAFQWELDVDAAARLLVDMARGRDEPEGPAAAGQERGRERALSVLQPELRG